MQFEDAEMQRTTNLQEALENFSFMTLDIKVYNDWTHFL